MALSEDLPKPQRNQQRSHGRHQPRRWARSRRCLLKGCGRVYRPNHPLERYCREVCRQDAMRWRRWKAQQKYRGTECGKTKRKEQCLRRRKRRKARESVSEVAAGGARVTPIKFFRWFLRSTWLLREVRKKPALSIAAVLLARMSACTGARSGAGGAMERARRGGPLGVGVEQTIRPEPMNWLA
jgi:hypothetical protein